MSSRKRRSVRDESPEEEDVRPTQRRRAADSDVEEEEEHESAGETNVRDEADEQLVKKLVRFALASSLQRKPIRRPDITEKVFQKKRGVSFKKIFDMTQKALQEKFGMMLVELPVKEKHTMKDKRAALNKSGASTSSTSYELISILPIEYKTPTLIPPSKNISTAYEASYIGICTIVVSILALSPEGKCLEAKLFRHFENLNIDEIMLGEKRDVMMKKMAAQGYIHRIYERTQDDETIEWTVGPRGKVEIGDRGIIGFAETIYGDKIAPDYRAKLQRSLGMEVSSAGSRNEKRKAVVVDQEEEGQEVEEDSGGPGPSTQKRRSQRRGH